MAKEGGEADIGDDIESLAENVIKKLETVFLAAGHELFFGAITAMFHGCTMAVSSFDGGENRNDQKSNNPNTCYPNKNIIHTTIVSRIANNVKLIRGEGR